MMQTKDSELMHTLVSYKKNSHFLACILEKNLRTCVMMSFVKFAYPFVRPPESLRKIVLHINFLGHLRVQEK